MESAPPDSITRSGSPDRIRPLSRAEASGPSMGLLLESRAEQAARLVEALELHLAEVLELEMVLLGHRVHHGVRDEYLAAAGAGHHARREVHIAAEVIAVAVQSHAVVDPDPGHRSLAPQLLEPHRPVRELRGV